MFNRKFKRRSIRVLKLLKGEKYKDSTVIALFDYEGDKKILKIQKSPGWNIMWEYHIMKILNKYLPSIKQFSKVLEISKIKMDVDDNDIVIFPPINAKQTRLIDVLLLKYVEGIRFARLIKNNRSYRLLFSGIYQILSALICAQKILSFTHYDLHANNIIVRTIPLNTVFLYDFKGISPKLVYSEGILLKIIDYEYTHVEGINGIPFDAKLDLLKKCYNSSYYDSEYDCIRFLISTLNFYSKVHNNKQIAKICEKIYTTVNESSDIKINYQGVLGLNVDSLKNKILLHEELKDLSNQDADFLDTNYYSLISILAHSLKYPLHRHYEKSSIWKISVVFRLLLDLKIERSKLTYILYQIVKGEDVVPLLISSGLVNEILWIETMKKSIEEALPHLESELATLLEWLTQKREKKNYSAETMLDWLSTNFYKQDVFLDQTFVVYWMNDFDCIKVPLENVPLQALKEINNEPQFSKKAVLLQKIVSK